MALFAFGTAQVAKADDATQKAPAAEVKKDVAAKDAKAPADKAACSCKKGEDCKCEGKECRCDHGKKKKMKKACKHCHEDGEGGEKAPAEGEKK